MTVHRLYLLTERGNLLFICVVLLILCHVISCTILCNLDSQIFILSLKLLDLVVEAFNFILVFLVAWVHLFINLLQLSNFIGVIGLILLELNKLNILLHDLLLLVLNKCMTPFNLLFRHVTELDEELCLVDLKIHKCLDLIKIRQFLLYNKTIENYGEIDCFDLLISAYSIQNFSFIWFSARL